MFAVLVGCCIYRLPKERDAEVGLLIIAIADSLEDTKVC